VYQNLLCSSSFWCFLLSIDQELAQNAQSQGCSCGGRLHCANYFRKPWGAGTKLPAEYCYRFSFCCNREGCRKRVTPPSVRFLGRKVCLGVVVVLVGAMRDGLRPRAVRELSERFGVDRRTIARWQVFWRELFPQTAFWKEARGRLLPVVENSSPLWRLLKAFLGRGGLWRGWGGLLRFLSPITVSGGLKIKVS